MNQAHADSIKPGDIIDGYVVVESREYLPNPDVMWILRTNAPPGSPTESSFYFIPRDDLIEYTPRLIIRENPLGI